MTTIRIADVLIHTDKLPPIRSQHTGVSTYYRSRRGGWKYLLGVVGLVAMAIVAAGVWNV